MYILIVFCSLLLATVASISINLSSIPILNGTNFKDWKDNILIVLGYMDLYLALRIEQPHSLTTKSSSNAWRHFEKLNAQIA